MHIYIYILYIQQRELQEPSNQISTGKKKNPDPVNVLAKRKITINESQAVCSWDKNWGERTEATARNMKKKPRREKTLCWQEWGQTEQSESHGMHRTAAGKDRSSVLQRWERKRQQPSAYASKMPSSFFYFEQKERVEKEEAVAINSELFINSEINLRGPLGGSVG